MCRFLLYLGPPITIDDLITRPSNSLINQSFHSHERIEPLNGDGFGVAWYAPEITSEPGRFRSVSPAWNNENLLRLSRVTKSGCVLAHVRAASPGLPVIQTNCHPFVHGRYSFMHNGTLAGFRALRRQVAARLSEESFESLGGTTDSEHLFALFLDRLDALNPDVEPDPAAMLGRALHQTITGAVRLVREAGVGEISQLNLAVSDGTSAAVSRVTTGPPESANSLHIHTGKRYLCEGNACRMVDPEVGHEAVLVASEPLSNDPGWAWVPPNHMVLIRPDRSTEVLPCLPAD